MRELRLLPFIRSGQIWQCRGNALGPSLRVLQLRRDSSDRKGLRGPRWRTALALFPFFRARWQAHDLAWLDEEHSVVWAFALVCHRCKHASGGAWPHGRPLSRVRQHWLENVALSRERVSALQGRRTACVLYWIAT